MSPAGPSNRDPHAVRRNLVCHVLEGGLYMGGVAFLAQETVMPHLVETLQGPSWIIAMMPVLLPAASACAGVFVAPVVERLTRFKPWVLGFGLLQRLPYLITGLILLYAQGVEGWLLPLVVLTPVVTGLITGLTAVAWMEMVTRMVPEKLRSAGWSARYIIQAVIGMMAGAVIHQVLTHFPGREGYGWLHITTFGFLLVSWMAQLPMREGVELHPLRQKPVREPYGTYLAGLPALFMSRPHLFKLVLARFTGFGFLMIVPFLTLHGLEVSGRAPADVGRFVTWQAVGTVLGSLLAGWVGYRSGGKLLLLAARAVCLALCVWASITQSFGGFMLSYFALGFGLFLDRVGDLTLAAELCPVERRSTLQAFLSFFNVFALLLATFISGQVYAWTQSFQAVAATAGVFAVLSILLVLKIPEPRQG